jgi:hypothetical protein
MDAAAIRAAADTPAKNTLVIILISPFLASRSKPPDWRWMRSPFSLCAI